jgi:hypothetical protein
MNSVLQLAASRISKAKVAEDTQASLRLYRVPDVGFNAYRTLDGLVGDPCIRCIRFYSEQT